MGDALDLPPSATVLQAGKVLFGRIVLQYNIIGLIDILLSSSYCE